MKFISMSFILLLFFHCGKTQQVIDIYPEDDCAEHVGYGAFLPANINSEQDIKTKKNLDKYQLDFKVEKETYVANETVVVTLSNKSQKPVELTVEPTKKSKCKSKDDYFVWTGEQAGISLVRISFLGDKKTLNSGQTIQFRIHLKTDGKYKFGLLVGNGFGDDGLIVTSAFEIIPAGKN